MYTSKSLLDSITVGKLEFDCANICAWVRDNESRVRRGEFLPLPIEVVDRIGPVSKLDNGCFGGVYKLLGYPGLILKLCFRKDDGYPEFIRSIAVKRQPKWAPVIFAHGGDECEGGFWCVMPEYQEVRCQRRDIPLAEPMHLMRAAGYYGWDTDYKSNEFVRTHRSDIEISLSRMHRAGAWEDCHSGNIMYDPVRKHHVITDPIGCWEPEHKEAYRHAQNS
jgi:hypothetical protein